MNRPQFKRAGMPLHAFLPGPGGAAAPAMDADGGFLAGHASRFGEADGSGDVVAPGAFARALHARKGRIAMLWQHDPARPIGRWTRLEEDSTGLWAEGALALESQAGREAHALLRAGAVTGLSIGFQAVRAQRRPGGGRVLREIDLWEISLVTFPMLDSARVTRVKGMPEPFSAAQARALARVMRRAAEAVARPLCDRKGEPTA